MSSILRSRRTGLLLPILSAALGSSSEAQAQFLFQETIGGFEVGATSNQSLEVFLQFGNARAAYRNGLKLASPWTSAVCRVDPGDPSQDEPSCLFWTGDCAQCPPDPGSPPGTLSCFCKKADPAWSRSEPVVFVPPGSTGALDLGLVTDRHGQGIVDQRLYGDPALNPQGSDQLRIRRAGPRSVSLQWEDARLGGDGDFNDFEALATVRVCSDGHFPAGLASSEGGGWSCVSACEGPIDCPLDHEQLDFHAFVEVDEALGGDVDRESPGRLLRLTLETYGDATVAGSRMAMCPKLLFQNPAGQVFSFHRLTYGIDRFDGGDCKPSEPDSGRPTCDPQLVGMYQLPSISVSMARDQQEVLRSCDATRVGPGDGFEVVPPRLGAAGCQHAMAHVETYEIPLTTLDRMLAAEGVALPSLETLPGHGVLGYLVGVEILAVVDLKVEPFFCPLGLNNHITAIHEDVGTVQQKFVARGHSGYQDSVRP